MGKMTRERVARMTDNELLAYERERRGDPYMTVAAAKGAAAHASPTGITAGAGRR
jgi:hypothetical protein